VTIDALALRGFAPGQRDAIADGLRAELAHLVAAAAGGAAFAHGRSIAALNLGKMQVKPGESANRLGRMVARRLAKGIC
jgi:hypothetical protein